MSGALADRARRWSEQLEAWAIPEEILRGAPESPWGFPVGMFTRNAEAALADEAASPSRARALEAVDAGGTVLDVGAGAGAASLPLAPPADRLVAVDENVDMLESLGAMARERSIPHRVVVGRWPDVAGEVEPADVVVCHHVLYNVADAVPFLTELHSHAHRRVVLEMTERHPQRELNELWKELHGVERPLGPGAADLAELIDAMGIAVHAESFTRPSLWSAEHRDHQVAFARKRLCLGPERDADVARLLPASTDRRLVTLWWDT